MIRRVSARGAVLVALAAAAVVLVPSPAVAAQQPPPWFHADCAGTYYAGYRIDPPNPSAASRTTYQPVTLTRETNAPLDTCFDREAGPDTNGIPDDEFGWPATWSAGGFTLTRVQWCDHSSSQCSYQISGGSGNFWFFGGTPTTNPDGSLSPDPSSYSYEVVLTPPDIVIGPVSATFSDPATPGKVRLEAPGTADGLPGDLSYSWVLHGPNGDITGAGPVFETTLADNGDYCVDLTVTASDGYSRTTESCASGGYRFNVSNIPSGDPGPEPDPDPTPPPGGGGVPTGGGRPGAGSGGDIFFAKPASAPRALSGGGASTPTIVWLWRPEWYQPELDATGVPQTDVLPKLEKRQLVVSPGREGASAGPWLAGLSAFGLLGGGWMISRRRRIRMLGEV